MSRESEKREGGRETRLRALKQNAYYPLYYIIYILTTHSSGRQSSAQKKIQKFQKKYSACGCLRGESVFRCFEIKKKKKTLVP